MGNFKFGDHATKDFDLVIQEPPAYNFPEKDLTTEHIPGRNGDLIIDNNCWKNVERTYSVASVFKPGTDFVSNSERLIKWLTSYKGYHRLEDSYDPEVFRIAQYKNGGSLVNFYDKATVLNVTFDCKPQRYLKNGEKPVHFTGSVATLENPTGYVALPEIHIDGVFPQDNEVLLLTVKDLKENNVTSIISLNKLLSATEPYSVILDSELQMVSSNEHDDINLYINLNETEFPKLYKEKTLLELAKYIDNENFIPKYDDLINEEVIEDNTCLAKYRPFDSIVETKQKSIFVMSFDLLKQKAEEVYEMKSYANYCLEKAETFTFRSFNTILQNTSQAFSFQGDYSSQPDWINISGSGDNIVIKVGNLASLAGYSKQYGYFITSNTGGDSDKKIIRGEHNTVLATGVKSSSTVTITFYPADSDGNLDVNYEEEGMPNWLSFEIEYDDVSGVHSPSRIIFKHKTTGYYYLPKSGLFGKAGWAKYTSQGELNSLSWSSWKKAFMPSGISTSTTVSYTYYYIPYPYKGTPGSQDYQEYLQYEPVYINVLNEDGSVKKDANGNPITKISNDVYFDVVPIRDDLTEIKFLSRQKGYFRFNDADQHKDWIIVTQEDVDQHNQITGPGVTSKSTSSNIIYFLKDIPDYSIVDGWPEWLDKNPLLYRDNQDNKLINADTFDFTVLKSGWYKYTYYDQLDNTLNTNWVYRNAGDRLDIISPDTEARKHDVSFTIYMLEGEQDAFPVKEYSYTDPNGVTIKNIAFVKIKSDGSEEEYSGNTPPSWLKVLITQGEKEDYSDWLLDFYPQQSGLYKWDTMSVWNQKQASDEHSLVTSTGTDDTSIYFMQSAPEYPTSGTIYDYCRAEVNINNSNGNPESVTIYAKQEGYYKAKNDSSWKYYKVNDEICNSKVSEKTDIHYLTESQETIDDITISVIPRWWSL